MATPSLSLLNLVCLGGIALLIVYFLMKGRKDGLSVLITMIGCALLIVIMAKPPNIALFTSAVAAAPPVHVATSPTVPAAHTIPVVHAASQPVHTIHLQQADRPSVGTELLTYGGGIVFVGLLIGLMILSSRSHRRLRTRHRPKEAGRSLM